MLIKHVDPNCVLPRGYGLVYFDWVRNRAVCMPVVLNVIARWARSAWIWTKVGRQCHGFQDKYEAYRAGVHEGAAKERQRIEREVNDSLMRARP